MAEDGEDDLQDAASDRQDAVLEASWRALGRSWSGPGGSLGSKALRAGVNRHVKGAGRRNGERCLRLRLEEVCRV